MLRKRDRHGSRKHQIRVLGPKRFTGLCDGKKRRRTCGLHGHCGATQIKLIGDPRRKKIGAAPDEFGKPADLIFLRERFNECAIMQNVADEIRRHTAAGVDPDTLGRRAGIAAGILERSPTCL